ncbi:uncharacterized protein LOC116414744 [Apis florea]|uniref:uncharacterized protein LOC116414744 n=1 Tax=Apis florea TaxID=7463 RepID=UPI0012FEA03E|nr:uncharacterized protein LOC116414744 [Apis florea]
MGASPHSGHSHMRRIHNLARFIGEIYIAKMISLARLMSSTHTRRSKNIIRQSSFSRYSWRTAVAIRTNSASKDGFNSAELGVRNLLFPVRETPEISRVRVWTSRRGERKKEPKCGRRTGYRDRGIANVDFIQGRNTTLDRDAILQITVTMRLIDYSNMSRWLSPSTRFRNIIFGGIYFL